LTIALACLNLQAADETRRVWTLPIEAEVDLGADNGDATLLRFSPIYGYPKSDRWSLINLDLIGVADAPGGVPGRPGNPEPGAGGHATGLTDLVHASFVTPARDSDFIWGLGGILSAPIATDDALGSGKWSAGPAFRVTYRSGGWNVGAFGGQMWSFAGNSDRADVRQLIIRGAIRRQLGSNWFFVSAPIITANWNAPRGNRWLVPIGGGFGRAFQVGAHEWAASMQGYVNAVKPSAAPDWSIRLALVANVPRPF